MGARSQGIGGAASTISDANSIFNNVAGLANVSSSQFSTSYDATPSTPGANRMAATGVLDLNFIKFGAGFFRFGDALYNEQMFVAAISNRLGIASLGLRGNLIQYHAEGFTPKRAVTIDFGGIVEFTKRLSFGAYITNMNQPALVKSQKEHLPTKLTAGIGYAFTSSVLVCTQLEKDLEYTAVWKAGLEYNFREKFYFRTGYNLNPDAGFLGLGTTGRKLTIDYAMKYSDDLGTSYQASVTFKSVDK